MQYKVFVNQKSPFWCTDTKQ